MRRADLRLLFAVFVAWIGGAACTGTTPERAPVSTSGFDSLTVKELGVVDDDWDTVSCGSRFNMVDSWRELATVRLRNTEGDWMDVTPTEGATPAHIRRGGPNGAVVWARPVASQLATCPDVNDSSLAGLFYHQSDEDPHHSDGGSDSVALAVGNGLVFALLYSRMAPGVDVYAFDFRDGTPIWHVPIREFVCPVRSRYQNNVTVWISGEQLWIRGVESMGSYVLTIGIDGAVKLRR